MAEPQLISIDDALTQAAPAGPESATEGQEAAGLMSIDDAIVDAGGERPDNSLSFGQSVGRGVDLAQAMGGGFVEASGEATGLDTLRDWGREIRTRNVAEAGQAPRSVAFENIRSFGDFGDWVRETAGEQLPLMAPSLVGGAAGGAIGAATPVPGGAVLGAAIGAFAPSFVLGVGETQGAIKEKSPDTEAPGMAFLGGSAIAALDSVLPGKIGSSLVRKLGKEAAETVATRALLKRVAIEGGKGMAVEGITEAIQEAVGEVAAAVGTDQEVDWEGMRSQMIEAGAAGALMGGGASAITATVPDRPAQQVSFQEPAAAAAAAPEAAPGGAPLPPDGRPVEAAPTGSPDPDAPPPGTLDAPDVSRETKAEQAPEPAPSGVPFMLTAAMREELGALGYGPEQVRALTPEAANRIIGGQVRNLDLQAAQAETQPTDAQKEAGNYRKGHIRFQGLDISVENPAGSERSGTDAAGNPWSVPMQAHYGYIKRTEGGDGEQIDVYVGPVEDAPNAYVVDQIDPETGKFDEHKVILGANTAEEAQALYDAHFNDGSGPARRGAVTELPMDDFKTWVRDGETAKPLAYVEPAEQAAAETPAQDFDLIPVDDAVAEAAGLEPVKTVRPTKSRKTGAQSLLEFIADRGGITDPGGDLKAMGADSWHRQAPFRKRLVKDASQGQGGMFGQADVNSPDYVREAAIEAGFLPEGADVNALLDAINAEIRGREQVRPEDMEARNARARDDAIRDDRMRRGQIIRDIRALARELGEPFKQPEVQAVIAMMEAEPSLQVEDAVELHIERLAIQAAEEYRNETRDAADDIPFETGPEPTVGRPGQDGRGQPPAVEETGRGETVRADSAQAGRQEVIAGERSPAFPKGLFVQLGDKRYEVASYQDASRIFEKTRDAAGTGGSQTPTPLITDGDGRVIGYIAYNGRIFEGRPENWSGKTRVLYDARKSPEAITEQADTKRLPQSTETLDTADGKKEQAVIPGAERDEQGANQRRADAPLKPTEKQKGVDGLGLFDEGSRDTTGNLFDRPAQDKPAPRAPDADFEAVLRDTKFAAKRAAKASDGRGYRIHKDGDGYIAMRMPNEPGQMPTYFRPENGTWTENEAVARVLSEIGKPAQPNPKTEAVRQPADKIDDFGEKIGGARKDLDIKTGERGTARKDDRPAWRRRYAVVQIAAETAGGRSTGNAGKWSIADTRTGRPLVRKYFDTQEEAEEALPLAVVSQKHRVIASDGDTFKIIRDVTDRKRATIKDGFETRDDAMRYIAENAVEIIETKTRIDPSIDPALEEAIRKGDARREEGRDVTADDFTDIFGFRGVEFGNWNNQAERQHIMNQAFDALLDMAELIGVDPKAISLNGELAIAFGARGSGLVGAKAHYESDYGVINLTKIKGAGSLAHEWLHAFDHYLGRQAGKAGTEKIKNSRGDMVFPAKGADRDFVSHGFGYKAKERTRAELRDAFDAVMDAITYRKMEYVEDASQREKIEERRKADLARKLDDFRADLTRELSWGAQKYRKPASPAQLKKVDALLDRIRNGDYGKDVYIEPSGKSRMSLGYQFPEVLVGLSKLHKEIRGRQGYGRQQGRQHGPIVDLSHAIKAQVTADQFLAEAKEQKVKTKTVKSDYYSQAWRIDQGGTKDYWSTPHELAARAFGAYIYDRLKDIDARNDFLSYEQHNDMPAYRLYGVKPFPEGAERTAINNAFDNLFDVIETRETDRGVEMYRVRGDEGRQTLSGSMADMETALRARLKALGVSDPAKLSVKVRDEIAAYVDGRKALADGRYYDRMIEVAFDARRPFATLDHEAIHGFRDLGLFTTTEWNLLANAVKRDRALMARIDGFAEYRDLTPDERIEEAVAFKFQDRDLRGRWKAIKDRISAVIEAIGNWLRGNGFQSAESVFRAIERGDVGSRQETRTPGEGPMLAAAYHGSPHDFDAFSTDRIGTGEGAQAFGWGLYFAGKKEVAEHYRQGLSYKQIRDDFRAALPDDADFEEVMDLVGTGHFSQYQERVLRALDADDWLGFDYPSQAISAALGKNLDNWDPSQELRDAVKGAGRLYEVELAPQEDEYLLWDKPLSEQSEKVKAAVEPMLGDLIGKPLFGATRANDGMFHPRYETVGEDGNQIISQRDVRSETYPTREEAVAAAKTAFARNIDGQQIYKQVSRREGSDSAASEALRAAGIPGIKYLDGSSRSDGDGTYNYVIFDASLVEVKAKHQMREAAAPEYMLPPEESAGPHEATISRIMGTTDKPVSQRIREGIDAFKERGALMFKQGLFDQFAVIEDYEKARFGGVAEANASPFKATHMTQNLQSVMGAVLRFGPLKVEDGWFKLDEDFGKGFEQIFEPLAESGKLRLWKGWAIANRAKRLMAEGREHLLTEAEINELLPLGDQHPEFQEVLDEWTAFNERMLDMAEAAGLINKDQRALWEKSDYVPFYRIIEDAESVRAAKSGRRGLEGQRSGIKALKGGEDKINDPLENMVLSMTSLVDRSFKNLAMQKVTALLEDAGAMEQAPKDFVPAYVPAAEAVKRMNEVGIPVDELSREERDQVIQMFQITAPREHDVVSVMVGGKPVWYKVTDPLVLKAVTSLHPEQMGTVMKIFRMAKRTLTQGVTADPAFMLANFMRDVGSAFVTAPIPGMKPGIDAIKGFKKALMGDVSLARLMASGGGSGGFYRTDPSDVRKQMDARHRGIDRTRVIDTPKKAWELWRRVGQASEAANRLAIMEAVKKNGGSDAEAAYQALDLMDFSMRGDFAAVRVLTEMVPFMNARIQGLYRLYRGARDNPKAFLIRGSIITAASMALLAANWDDERYDDLEDWDKDTYYHFWIGGEHYRIPKPFEVGALFSTIPERMLRLMAGKDDGEKAAQRTLAMIADTFAMNPIPQLLKPTAELWANKSFFTGRDIVGQGLDRLDPEAQWQPWTSLTARWLGEVLPDALGDAKSPKRIEHLVRGYFGALGMYVLGVSDSALRLIGDYPNEPTGRREDIPVLGRFLRDSPARSSVHLTDFYDMQTEAGRLLNTIREYERRGMKDEARELFKERQGEIQTAKGLNKVAVMLGDINRTIRAVHYHPTMSPAEKRRLIDKMTEEKNLIVKMASQRARATMAIVEGLKNKPQASRKLQPLLK